MVRGIPEVHGRVDALSRVALASCICSVQREHITKAHDNYANRSAHCMHLCTLNVRRNVIGRNCEHLAFGPHLFAVNAHCMSAVCFETNPIPQTHCLAHLYLMLKVLRQFLSC
jgi:hypothetical protein